MKVNDMVRITAGPYSGKRGRIASIEPSTQAAYTYYVKVYGSVIRYVWFKEGELEPVKKTLGNPDAVDHPSHYTWLPNGIEVIDLTEHMNFNRGNAVKYLARAGRKNPATELEDLRKARWYIDREISRMEKVK
ncbi:DUF3310 domain-containing protein [Streptomyces pseudogriseolus]|uniref:DUF3310 domain-containing protein n=1 Tax=Streptomyces pseudogriseolus TaxID=36817 RepID=UPI003FA31DDC